MVHNNPDIVTNVYKGDEWFMNRHRPEEMKYFQEAKFSYTLFEPGLLEADGVSKVFFTCDDHDTLLPLEQAINARWGDRGRLHRLNYLVDEWSLINHSSVADHSALRNNLRK